MQTSKKMSKSERSVFIILTICFLPLFIYIFLSQSEGIDDKLKTHPNLYRSNNLSSKLEGISMETGFKNKGMIYLDLSNGKKYSLLFNPVNYNYSPNNLLKFINVGDSIYKRANSDTIHVYQDHKEYYFVLGEIINRE